MAYNFSLRDEEDELVAPLLEEESFSLAQPGAGPSASIARAPAAEPWAPVMTQRDPAMAEKWSLAEKNMLERAQYNPNEYGLSEGLRDNAGMALAGVLDVALNKGRGLGQIATESAKLNQMYEGRRREDAQNAGNFALRARQLKSTDLADQLAVKRLQNQDRQLLQQDQRIELALQGEGRRGGEFDRKYNADNPAMRATKEALINSGVDANIVDRLDQKGLDDLSHRLNLDIDHANAPRKLGDDARHAAATSAASTDASQRVQTNWAPSLGAARGEGERRAEVITRPEKVRTSAETTAATTAAGYDASAPKRDAENQEKFAKNNEKLLRAREALSAVHSRTGEGKTPEGLDFKSRALNAVGAGDYISEGAQLNIQDLTAAAESVMRDDSGAAIGVKEGAKGMLDALGSPTLSAERKWAAIQNFERRLDNQLRGQAVDGGAAQKVVERAGIKGLDVTAPSAAPAPAGGKRTVTMTKNGVTETQALSERQIQNAIRAGWSMQ